MSDVAVFLAFLEILQTIRVLLIGMNPISLVVKMPKSFLRRPLWFGIPIGWAMCILFWKSITGSMSMQISGIKGKGSCCRKH